MVHSFEMQTINLFLDKKCTAISGKHQHQPTSQNRFCYFLVWKFSTFRSSQEKHNVSIFLPNQYFCLEDIPGVKKLCLKT